MFELKLFGKKVLAIGKAAQPNTTELGASGTSVFSGKIYDESNAKLRGQQAILKYDKMRRTDGSVKAILLALSLPIRSAEWFVTDKDADPKAVEFIKEALFDRMTISFDEWMQHVLLMLPFGHSVFEKVFKIEDGKVWWRKLAPRLPKTINKWEFDGEGGLAGIQQFVQKDKKYQYIPIPVEQLLVFTMDREGSNYEGISVLRSAYKHWYIKDLLYRISGIGLERQAIGLPTIKLPQGYTPADVTKAEDLVKKLRVNEESGAVLPEGFEFDIKEGKIQGEHLLKNIQHHDGMIAKCVLAQFLQLGQEQSGGAYALSKDQSDFFLMALKAICQHIANVMNRHAIPQLMEFNNFSKAKAYPKLDFSLGKMDNAKLIEGIKAMVDGGVIQADDKLEEHVRDILSLPQIDEGTARQKPVTPPQFTDRSKGRKLRLAEKKYWRELTVYEEVVKFKEIDDRFDKGEEALVKDLGKVAVWQRDDLLKQIDRAVETGKVNELYKITVRYRGDYAETLRRYMGDLSEFGASVASAEMKIKIEKISVELKNWLQVKADTIVEAHATKMKTTAMLNTLNGINAGLANKAILFGVKEGIQKYLAKELQATASVVVGESVNWGRNEVVGSGMVQAAQYSAILDSRTCALCRAADSKVVDIDDPDFDRFTPPVHSNCRCIWVYIHKDEEDVEVDWQTPENALIDKHGKLVA